MSFCRSYEDLRTRPVATAAFDIPLAQSTQAAIESRDNERELIRWERELLQRERELLERERATLSETRTATVSQTDSRHWLRESAELLPVFDPSKTTTLTAQLWVKKVENVARLYEWDERATLLQAIPKLKNAARFWYESLTDEVDHWETFKLELIKSFPSRKDESDVHFELTKRVKRRDECYESYFYEMKAIASRALLSERAVMKYIVAGLEDVELRKMLTLGKYVDSRDLLMQVKAYESAFERRTPRDADLRSQRPTPRETDAKLQRPAMPRGVKCFNCDGYGHMSRDCVKPQRTTKTNGVKCFNCNEEGHRSRDCLKPQRRGRCFKCDKVGHVARDCRDQRDRHEADSTNIRRVTSQNEPMHEYHKYVKLCGGEVLGFVDLGSDCVTLKESAARRLGMVYRREWRPKILKGFGQGSSRTVGAATQIIVIEGVEISVEVLIVPDEAQDDDIIVGRSALDQKGIRVVKETGKLTIQRIAQRNDASAERVYQLTKDDKDVSDDIQDDDIYWGEGASPEEKEKLRSLINDYRGCFAQNLEEIGTAKSTKMTIELTSDEPVKYRPYRLPYAQREKVKTIIEELLDSGIIRESTSEYASPILLVKKRTGEERLCIDYRRLNSITKKEHPVMPVIDDQLDRLAGNNYFTILDLSSGYYQVEIEEECKRFTAFVTNEGHYEFNKMPFGLVNAPTVFNKIMSSVVRKIQEKSVYMDDIMIPSVSVNEGLARLEEFLNAIQEEGMTLKLKKCKFFQQRVEFLGYEISESGIQPGHMKTGAIEGFARPENVHDIRRFCGLTSYFRKFVPNHAELVKPLTELTKKEAAFVWTERQEDAFLEVKRILTERPVLALFDPKSEHQVHTDASCVGLAGILLQKDPTKEEWRPVAYYSRRTTDQEAKYHSFELEALAIVETVDRFRIYLLGRKFTVLTDCNSLKTAMTKRDLVPRIGRWWLKLQEYDFELAHRAGEKMKHVDALSRHPTGEAEEPETASLKMYQVHLSEEDWLLTLQLQDPKIRQIVEKVKSGDRQTRTDYLLRKERLYRKTTPGEKWVVPHNVRRTIVRQCHDDVGHYGLEKTLGEVQKHYWFPKMKKFVRGYLNACVECAYHKTRGGKREGELYPISTVPRPFDTMHIDHLGPFPKTKKGKCYILVCIDAFTRYAVLTAVRNVTAKTTVETLEEMTGIFGPPRRIVTDQGTAFTASTFKEFCEQNDIVHVKNATATPRANGQVERYNRTVLGAIRTMTEQEDEWDRQLRAIQWGLNSIKQKVTGLTPHELLFAYEPRNALGNKVLLALQEEEQRGEDELPLGELRRIAVERTRRDRDQQKRRYDEKRRRPTVYVEGDMVLIEREPFATGKSKKLAPKYKGPYQVKGVLGNDRYLLIDIKGAERTQRPFEHVYSSDRMKRWCEPQEEDETETEGDDMEEEDTRDGVSVRMDEL